MDIRINLLPPEIQTQYEQRRHRQQLLGIGSMLFLLLLCVYSFIYLANNRVQDQLKLLEQENQNLQKQTMTFDSYVDLQERVSKTEVLLRQAVGTPPAYEQILAGIGLQIPANVWLTDFTANYKLAEKNIGQPSEAPNKVEEQVAEEQNQLQAVPNSSIQQAANGEVIIRGSALNHQAVAVWLEQLRQVSGLTGIRCQFSAQSEAEGNFISFEVKAKLIEAAPLTPKAGE